MQTFGEVILNIKLDPVVKLISKVVTKKLKNIFDVKIFWLITVSKPYKVVSNYNSWDSF
jgi:hypothetical protein